MYNIAMADNDMLETDFLFQPRGPGTGWCFRMITPAALVGKLNPRTERPYGREIREGLGTRNLKDARKLRDLYLGKIRLEESGIVASARSHKLAEDDPQGGEYRAARSRQYAEAVKDEAQQTNLAYDATVRFKDELAKLN
jgi:hypothetical protein